MVDWQKFVTVPSRRVRQVVMIVAGDSRYSLAAPPDYVLQPRNGVIVQIAPETRVPVVWDTDERGFWVPVERGHSRTREMAERHHTSERAEAVGVGTHGSVFGGTRRADRNQSVREETITAREARGIFRRQKTRRHARGNVFFPGRS